MRPNVLSNHRFDPAYAEREKKRKANRDSQRKSHEDATTDYEDEQREAAFAQFKGSCWCCRKKGHHSPKCPDKDKPKLEWAFNKTKEMQHAQQAMNTVGTNTGKERSVTSTTTSATTQANSSDTPFWAGGAVYVQLNQSMIQGERVSFLSLEDLKKKIILDSGSSAHVFCNSEYLANETWDAKDSLTLVTNGGPFQTRKRG